MHTTCSEHRNLEFGTDWRSAPWFWSNCRHQVDLRLDVAFCLSRKSLYSPHDSLLFGLIFGAAKRILNLCLGGILRDGYLDDDVSGKQLIRKIGNHFKIDRHPENNKSKRMSGTRCRFHTMAFTSC